MVYTSHSVAINLMKESFSHSKTVNDIQSTCIKYNVQQYVGLFVFLCTQTK